MTWNVAGGNSAGPLKYKRGIAIRRDLGNGASAEKSEVYDPKRTYQQWAKTLPDLHKSLGQFGPVAVCHARFGAMSRWLMDPECKMQDATDVAYEAIRLVREKALARARLPHPENGMLPVIIDKLDLDLQREAFAVVTRTRVAWKRAGKPYLNRTRIETSHMFIAACVRAIQPGTVH